MGRRHQDNPLVEIMRVEILPTRATFAAPLIEWRSARKAHGLRQHLEGVGRGGEIDAAI